MKNQQAFTLIELLVVVLIIGILAAVALPQYQKAVEKSRATQAMTLIKSAYQAAKVYQLANGEWPSSFDELSLDIPWSGTVQAEIMIAASISNDEWALALHNTETYHGFSIIRLSGKYKGGGFTIRHLSSVLPGHLDELLCYELRSGTYQISQDGIYCPKLFNATQIEQGSQGTIYTFVQ